MNSRQVTCVLYGVIWLSLVVIAVMLLVVFPAIGQMQQDLVEIRITNDVMERFFYAPNGIQNAPLGERISVLFQALGYPPPVVKVLVDDPTQGLALAVITRETTSGDIPNPLIRDGLLFIGSPESFCYYDPVVEANAGTLDASRMADDGWSEMVGFWQLTELLLSGHPTVVDYELWVEMSYNTRVNIMTTLANYSGFRGMVNPEFLPDIC